MKRVGPSQNLTGPIKQYLPCKSELTVNNGILLRGSRLVIPPALRPEIIEKLHAGHQGFTKCERRAQESVWWPRIRQDIDMKVSKCIVCSMYRSQKAEPLMPTTFPDSMAESQIMDLSSPRVCFNHSLKNMALLTLRVVLNTPRQMVLLRERSKL